MARPTLAVDASFWDLNIASPRNLDGCVRLVPGQPLPLDGSRGSLGPRSQQLSLLTTELSLPIIPSYSPSTDKRLGSFALQSFIFKQDYEKWLIGMIGQLRPRKLISSLINQFFHDGRWKLPRFQDLGKQFLDKSLYSLGLCSLISLSSSTSLYIHPECHGDKKGFRTKASIRKEFRYHYVTLEAAWPELFVDHDGGYWEVPESISLDMSGYSKDGFNYHVGVHKNMGETVPITAIGDVPFALMPGLWAKAAFAYTKTKDFWRKKTLKKDIYRRWKDELIALPAYDVSLQEPHSTIYGLIGGTCTAYYGGRPNTNRVKSTSKTLFLGADLFTSICYSLQHGKFRDDYFDLTRLDARLDISSVCGLAKRVSDVLRKTSNAVIGSESSPRISFIFQQQIVGPVVFRADAKFLMDSLGGKMGPHLEDSIFSLNYSVRGLQSGKVCLWYSPKKNEGMVELRLSEF